MESEKQNSSYLFDRKYIGNYCIIFTNLFLGFLSYFIPKQKNTALFGSAGNSFVASPKHFFLFLLKNNKEIQPKWITSNQKIFSLLKKHNFPVVWLYSLKGFFAILRSEFLIYSHLTSDVSFHFYLPGNFKKINTWHGSPIKNIDVDNSKNVNNRKHSFMERYLFLKERKSFHTLLAKSETEKLILQNSFKCKNVEILGFPHDDILINKKIIFENYYEKFGLSQYNKIFLYCPTWRGINQSHKKPFSEKFLSKLNKYLIEENSVFLVKKHVLDEELGISNFSNIIDVSDNVRDIQELLCHIDVLISDYSSVVFDFVLMEKPIIFYCHDFEEYSKTWDMYYSYFENLPGPFAKNENELIHCINNIEKSFNENEYKEKYISFKNRFNRYYDGDSCKRLLNYLLKI